MWQTKSKYASAICKNLGSGSGFSAMQWRQFPHRASVNTRHFGSGIILALDISVVISAQGYLCARHFGTMTLRYWIISAWGYLAPDMRIAALHCWYSGTGTLPKLDDLAQGLLGRYALPRNYSSSLIWFWALVHCIASLTLVRFGSILASRMAMYTLH